MKSERRHELEQNELADWLGDSVETVKPYANVILGVLLGALIVVVGGTWWVQQSQAKQGESWDAFYTALSSSNPADLGEMVEDYPDSKAADWARVVAGDMHLTAGCNQLFSNRANANNELDKAADFFEEVLDKSQQGVLLDRASYGLARTREAMGELDKAKELYGKVTKKWPDGPFAKISANRLEKLEQPGTLAFYDRFAKFDPKPAFSNQPGIPGAGPLFDDKSLLGPDSMFDPASLPNLDLKAVESDDQESEAAPKPEAAKPAETKPAAAAEKKADQSKTPAKK
ncbi:MAG: tetratricopeptide repeat protein [Planctomycetota bacterium]|nr:tetratricopeptide repeat protein [Planctomycetota bacterium]